MAKTRVYELGRELDLSTKEMMNLLHNLGITVKSHMSTLEEHEIELVRNRAGGRDQDALIQEKAEEKEKKGEKEAAGKSPGQPKVSTQDQQMKRVETRNPRALTTSVSKKPAKSEPLATLFHNKDFEHDEHEPAMPRRQRIRKRPSEERGFRKGKAHQKKLRAQVPIPTVRKKITLESDISVQELARAIGKTSSQVISKLMELGTMVTATQIVDIDTAAVVASELGVEVEIKQRQNLLELTEEADDPSQLVPRPPVVTVMGHVDHGKTSLLDAIRQTNVTEEEPGGITQHIGAYQVEVQGKKITFIDTPGHEAFTAMRARGAQATDIAVLVVAADDGVMPQTVEAINHAKAAGVPIVVALNKIDKADAQPDRIKQQLSDYGLIPEEWGGDTVVVPVSAVYKTNIDQLLEMILLVADLAELRANPNRPARGVIIEAELDRRQGPVATVLIKNGTLQLGDYVVAGPVYGRVRSMVNFKGERLKKAEPSTPVQVTGLSGVPEAGDQLRVVDSERVARQIAEAWHEERKQIEWAKAGRLSTQDLFDQMGKGSVKELSLIVKADTQGTAEALSQALSRLGNEEARVKVIHSGVGAVTETDVMLASASGAMIVAFDVRPDMNASKAAEKEKVEIRTYRIIYEALDEVKSKLSGLLEPQLKEVHLGRAEVRATFRVPKVGVVAGAYVVEGKLQHHARARLIRNGTIVHEGRIASLKRFKDDVKEVAQGFECGVGLSNFDDIKEGDIIEAFVIEEIKREL